MACSFNLGPLAVGCTPAGNVTVDLNESAVTSITNVVNQHLNTLSSATSNIQSLNVCTGTCTQCGPCPDGQGATCNVSISQFEDTFEVVTNTFTSSDSVTLSNSLTSSFVNDLSQYSNEIQGFLAAQPSGLNCSDVVNAFCTTIQTSVCTETLNALTNNVVNIETGAICLCQSGAASCNINQTILVTTYINNVVDNITNAVIGNCVLNSAITYIAQSQFSQSKGIDSLLDELLKFFEQYKWIVIAIIIAIVIVLAVLLVGVFILSGRSISTAGSTLTNPNLSQNLESVGKLAALA